MRCACRNSRFFVLVLAAILSLTQPAAANDPGKPVDGADGPGNGDSGVKWWAENAKRDVNRGTIANDPKS